MSIITDEVPSIPIVDFSALSIENEARPDVTSDCVRELAQNLIHAFSTSGFVYLMNHGIPQSEVDGIFNLMDDFFNLSKDVKSKYEKKDTSQPNGWDELEREGNSADRPGDLKESFDIGHILEDYFKWPDAEVPAFKPALQTFYKHLSTLGLRVLSAIAIGLGKDPVLFSSAFKHMGTCEGCTQLRLNYYPKLEDDFEIKPRQLRCAEHTDYGAIALLFQDSSGGLEVKDVHGKYVPVKPIEGAIIINIADLLERWTSDKLKSTYHRVLIPEDVMRKRARKSAVFFFDPDHDANIQCVLGINKYPPIKAGEYVTKRLAAGYKF
ncbi:2-oxoglutarate-Fe(II) type oxidoreductase ppzD [Nematostella vectensis]|uniref:2-oxoglutarate-Fe(II) type oxidoreductase ppzD n=1 Tax=Nematostella vectensis TaxID=45351 RepID=UPI00138FAD1A|nr:2-oxoglutarate-Fe(II) type oxidoreductase ppzD [Nematostella vectensis]